MATVAGYKRSTSRYGKQYWAHRSWLTDFDTWSLQEKSGYQQAQTVSLVRYATGRSAFYRDLYRDIDIASFADVADLGKLPFVDKEDLRVNISRIYTIPRRGSVEGHTGGTTGKSLVIRMTPHDMMIRMAMLDHFKSRVGFENRRMRRATFMGKHIVPPQTRRPVYWRYNHAARQMLYSTFHLSENNLGAYVASLNRFKPRALDGFFSSMLDIANYIERYSIELSFTPDAIFPTSETVTPSGRSTLERVFGAKVYNQYASSEGAPFVTECSHGSLHVELSTGVFEQVAEDTDEIAITSFTTHGTPLIRYRIGDSMRFSQERNCACGLESTLVESIEGRRDDYLLRADGARVNAGNVANLFKNMPNALIKAQVVQDALDQISIRLVVDSSRWRPEFDLLLRDEFLHKFGTATRLQIDYLDDIPREASGKHRLIKNALAVDNG